MRSYAGTGITSSIVHTRAVQWTALFSRLNRVTKGLPQALARLLYLAVAIPRIVYTVDVWLAPPHESALGLRQMGSIAIIWKLTSVQRLAAISIPGALHTTAGDVTEAHANIFSIRTLLTITLSVQLPASPPCQRNALTLYTTQLPLMRLKTTSPTPLHHATPPLPGQQDSAVNNGKDHTQPPTPNYQPPFPRE